MNSLERVLKTLSHEEADRVPVFMLFNLHGAKYHGVSIEEYYSNPSLVAEAQLHFYREYGNDIVHNFHYAGVEIKAFGGEVVFREDGPPNSGAPFIKKIEDIDDLEVPDITKSKEISNVLEVTRLLSEAVSGEVIIVGVVMSPFSLPVMQLGFENYLDLMLNHPKRMEKLMEVNKAFCLSFANAQLEAGCNAIVYFDPVSSPTVVTRNLFENYGNPIMKEMIKGINGPVVTHFASGLVLPIIEDIIDNGAVGVGISSKENLTELKKVSTGRITLLGNLNGIEMARWTKDEVIDNVTNIINIASKNGGFIVSDNHGEIPLQVPLDTVVEIIKTVHDKGKY